MQITYRAGSLKRQQLGPIAMREATSFYCLQIRYSGARFFRDGRILIRILFPHSIPSNQRYSGKSPKKSIKLILMRNREVFLCHIGDLFANR